MSKLRLMGLVLAALLIASMAHAGVITNEIHYDQIVTGHSEWIELYDPAPGLSPVTDSTRCSSTTGRCRQ